MGRSIGESQGRRADRIVSRFETAWLVEGDADLARFVPEPGHPARRGAIQALVRVDMEQRRAAGRPKLLNEYVREFPELDEGDLGDLALAEYRLRLDAGEGPSPDDYRRRFGVEADGWPSPDPSGGVAHSISRLARFEATVSRPAPDLASAARSYLDFRSGVVAHDGAVEAWAEPARSGSYSETVDLFVDLHKSDPEEASRLARGVVRLPEPGDTFLGFRLLDELGRGAFGRVYLASQGDLADRPVALKVSAEKLSESRTLAQLQHTNIVPIFSAHRDGPLQAVCMPYFGSTTLKDVFEDLEGRPTMPTSGRGLVETLSSRRGSASTAVESWRSRSKAGAWTGPVAAGAPPEAPTPAKSAPLSSAPAASRPSSDPLVLIGGLSYVGAILWLGARLADGLAHAHGRGILHRDLKPANILMTDSGQPMLLDFNLSEDTKEVASVASFGGTLPYMAPEHLRAFRGEDLPVDARSDIYALGIILYELLAGRHPFEVPAGCSPIALNRMIARRSELPPCLRERNPGVTPAVESIVRHCLEPDPSRRYQSADDLREDLERQMADLPLKHAPEPSARERAAKWARRHPRLTSSTSVAILIGCLALGVLAGFMARARKMARLEAEAALIKLRDDGSSVRYLLNTRVHDPDRRARAVAIGREVLGRYGLPDDPGWLTRPLASALDDDLRRSLRDEAGALLLSLGDAGRVDAEAHLPDDPARRQSYEAAARLYEVARRCFDDRIPRGLLDRQAELFGLLGRAQDAAKARAEAVAVAATTALDRELEAAALADRGEFRKAIPPALEATRFDPRDFWAWFTLGLSYERIGQDPEAAACFGTCIALRPDSPFGWFNRGVARSRHGDHDQARLDLERASALDPTWPDPVVERAIAEELQGRPADAVRDLSRAIELGATETRLYFLRSRARGKAGDAEGAKLDREEGLRREPRDALGWTVRALAREADDPAAALADLDRALAVDPKSLDALQGKAYVLAERMNRIEEAEAVCDRAVTLYPDFVPSRSARGVMRAILGRRDSAHQDARESIGRDASPRILYQVAGIYAVTSKQAPEDRVEALRLLSTALRNGFGFELLADDRELDALRDQPEFRKLLEAARALRDAEPKAAPGH